MLRSIFVFLICLHLGTAAWWAWHRDAKPLALAPNEKGVARLNLLSEVEQGDLRGAQELNEAPQDIQDTPLCLSIGAFDTPSDLRKAMNVLTPMAGRIQFREIQTDALEGYRVFLPAAASREEALQFARKLAGLGIRDYYVVTAGPQENTVSLGIFKALSDAENRKAVITQLGFNPMLETRSDKVSQWWIDVAVPEDFQINTVFPDTKLSVNRVSCQ
jgi:SPOR domain